MKSSENRTPNMTPSQSPAAGPSRRQEQRKKRGDDQGIPSDESDTGDRLTPTSRRFRKRKHIPVPIHLNLGGTKRTKTEGGPVKRVQHSNSVIDLRKASETLDNPFNSQDKKNLDSDPNLKLVQKVRRSHSFSRVASLLQKSVKSTSLEMGQQNESRSEEISPQHSVVNSRKLSHDWVLFSIWNPSWDFILKCEGGKMAIESNLFRKLVIEAIDSVTPFPEIYKQQEAFDAICIDDVKENPENCDLPMRGNICEFDQPLDTPTVNTREGKRVIIKFPTVLKTLLSFLVTGGDLIIIYYPPIPPSGRSNAEVQNQPDSIKGCVVHVTAKDYKKPNNGVPDIENLKRRALEVDSESADAVHEEYGSYNILKYTTPFLPAPSSSSTELLRTTITNQYLRQLECHQSAEAVATGTGPSSDILQQQQQSSALPNDVNNRITDESIENELLREKDLSVIDLSSEPVDRSTPTDTNSNLNGIHNGSQEVTKCNFNLQYWFNEGLFVPGPFRPRVKKPENSSEYKYHKLAELELLLDKSIEDEVKGGQIPTMMVKEQCHTYGVVVEVLHEERHNNSYFVRIADETRGSVLLRIHTSVKDRTMGPKIEVGHIIRIHRLTVQTEWDTGLSDNAMVLSTSPHHNYVLFTESKTYQFTYHTCAKTITLDRCDKIRVGELKQDMSKILQDPIPNQNKIQNQEEIDDPDISIIEEIERPRRNTDDVPTNNNTSSSVNDDLFRKEVPVLPSADDTILTDGINTEDIMSPPSSEIVELQEDDVGISHKNISQNCESQSDDEVFTTAPSSIVNSQNKQDQSQTLNDTTLPPSRRFTDFKDLRKTDDRLNLLCQIIRFYTTKGKDIWHVYLQDLEHTTPSEDFRHPIEDSLDGDNYLVLNITNARKLIERKIAQELYDIQGTNELYAIEDVKIKGSRPPYELEVDGETCIINRQTDVLEELFGLGEAFTSRVEEEGAQGEEADEDVVIIEDESSRKEDKVESHGRGGPVNAQESNGAPNKNCSTGPASATPNVRMTNSEQSNCKYETTKLAPSLNHHAGGHGGDTTVQENEVVEEWTGKARRRRRREHYQPEESFEC